MIKRFKPLSILIVIMLLFGMLVACQPEAPATEAEAPAEAEAAEAAPAEEEAEAGDEFNPDTNPDKISFDQLEAEFGAVPAPASGTAIGALEKNLANEFWIALEDGYKNKAEEYGIKLDSQASRTETE